MRTILFYIPPQIGGVPVFGFGILLGIWIAFSIVRIAMTYRQRGTGEVLAQLPVLLIVAAAIAWFSPRMLEPEGLPIRGYGLTLLVGVVLSVALAVWLARRMGVDPDVMYALAFWQFVGGILGARLFYVYEYWPHFQRESLLETAEAIVKLNEGGLVVYGGAIGAAAATILFSYVRRAPLFALCDLAAPSWMLGLAIGRIGCFLNGCCWGGACDLPWAVEFPKGSPPWVRELREGRPLGFRVVGRADAPPLVAEIIPGSPAAQADIAIGDSVVVVNDQSTMTVEGAQDALYRAIEAGKGTVVEFGSGKVVTLPKETVPARSSPVHPTQLYSTIDAGLLCLFLVAFYPYRRHDGEVLAMMLTVYPVFRFLVEFIRNDEPPILRTGMTISQNLSLVLLACAAALWAYLFTRPKGSVLPIQPPTPPAQPTR